MTKPAIPLEVRINGRWYDACPLVVQSRHRDGSPALSRFVADDEDAPEGALVVFLAREELEHGPTRTTD